MSMRRGTGAFRVNLRLILLAALALRVVWALLVPIHPVSDPSIYDMLAQRIAAGQGYSWPDGAYTAYWPVGTSALYALIYVVFGRNLLLVALVNAVLGTLLVAATYALARTGFSRCVALLAAALAALWPTWIALTSILSSELPTNLFFVSGLALALSRWGAPWLRVALSTVLLVGSTYCRANMLPFILFIPLLVAIRDRSARQFLWQAALAAGVAAMLIAPWAIRNQQRLGATAPISTNLGVNLWIGNNPQADGGFMAPPPLPGGTLPKGEVAQDRAYQAAAKDYIYRHPLRYAQLSARRLVIALDRETFGVGWNDKGLPGFAKGPLKVLMSAYWYVLFLAAVAGMGLFLWRRPLNIFSPFVALPVAIMATPVLVMSAERYHYGIAPFVAIFTASFVLGLRKGQEVGA